MGSGLDENKVQKLTNRR